MLLFSFSNNAFSINSSSFWMANNVLFLSYVFHLLAFHIICRNSFYYFLLVYISHKHLSFHMFKLCWHYFWFGLFGYIWIIYISLVGFCAYLVDLPIYFGDIWILNFIFALMPWEIYNHLDKLLKSFLENMLVDSGSWCQFWITLFSVQ